MPVERKTKPSTPPHPTEFSFLSLMWGWTKQGVESFFATQRILLDLVVQQNAHAMKVLREHWVGAGHGPATVVTELGGEGISNFIQAQKVLLTMAHKQGQLVMTGIQERVDSPLLVAMTEVVRRGVDTFVEMQNHFLTMADKETDALVEMAKTGKAYHGDSMKEIAQEAMDTFVRTQKKFLDVIAEETAHATNGKYPPMKKAKKTELTHLAEQATESFMDAQKKLLDVAGRQITANLKAATQVAGMVPRFSVSALAELTRDVVKSYVEAEKALLDVVVKPHHTVHPPDRPTAMKTMMKKDARRAVKRSIRQPGADMVKAARAM